MKMDFLKSSHIYGITEVLTSISNEESPNHKRFTCEFRKSSRFIMFIPGKFCEFMVQVLCLIRLN